VVARKASVLILVFTACFEDATQVYKEEAVGGMLEEG